MTTEEIQERVFRIVHEQFGVEKSTITRETHFINDLNADSLDGVEVLMEVEDEFEINIPDGDTDHIGTVGEAIDYVAKKKPE